VYAGIHPSWPAKTLSCFVWVSVPNFVGLAQTILAYTGGPKNLWDDEASPRETMAWLPPWKHSTPHLCYHTKFRCCGSNSFVVGRGPKNIRGDWGPPPWIWACLTPKSILLPTCYRARFGHSRSNRTSVIMKIWQKILTPRAPPFKVIQGHWNRHWSVGNLWLPICIS